MERIACSKEFVRRLRQVAATLGTAGESAVIAPDRIEQLKELVLTKLSGNYTMASERALHDLFGGGGGEDSPADSVENVDDLFF
jgi:hypothetical protein